MKLFGTVLIAYLRHGARQIRLACIGLLISWMTAFGFVALMYGAYPDDIDVFYPQLTRQVNYGLARNARAQDILARVRTLLPPEDIQAFCLMTMLANNPETLLAGVQPPPEPVANPLHEPFQWTPGEPYICAVDEALIPSQFALSQTQLPVTVDGRRYACVGLPTFAQAPQLQPLVFDRAVTVGLPTVQINGREPLAHDMEQREQLLAQLKMARQNQHMNVHDLAHMGVLPYRPFLAVYVPLDLYEHEQFSVQAVSILFRHVPDAERLRELDNAMEDWEPVRVGDIAVAVNASGYAAFANRVVDNLPRMVPLFLVMLLTQMAFWRAWLDEFTTLRTKLRILGASDGAQNMATAAAFLLLQSLAMLVLSFMLLPLRGALRSAHLVWTDSTNPLWLGLAGFGLICLVYLSGYLMQERMMFKEDGEQ